MLCQREQTTTKLTMSPLDYIPPPPYHLALISLALHSVTLRQFASVKPAQTNLPPHIPALKVTGPDQSAAISTRPEAARTEQLAFKQFSSTANVSGTHRLTVRHCLQETYLSPETLDPIFHPNQESVPAIPENKPSTDKKYLSTKIIIWWWSSVLLSANPRVLSLFHVQGTRCLVAHERNSVIFFSSRSHCWGVPYHTGCKKVRAIPLKVSFKPGW